jgi:predicted DNA-binding protein
MEKKTEKLVIKPKKLKGEDGYKTFSIRIKEETVGKIEAVSAKTGHTRNELIGIFLNYALEHCVIEE